ncbi:nSTAND1 domain-containing NTPase [Sorangium sp. So ce448]|uniref:nSTAND1 domain-containing NTPase n=1 Tax=Sorangium sp. So ce448 TaxID=3133314 RepID=UPI003F6487CE
MPMKSYPHWKKRTRRLNTEHAALQRGYVSSVYGRLRAQWPNLSKETRSELASLSPDRDENPNEHLTKDADFRGVRNWIQALVEATHDVINEGLTPGEKSPPGLWDLIDINGPRPLYTALFALSCWMDGLKPGSPRSQLRKAPATESAGLGEVGAKEFLVNAEATGLRKYVAAFTEPPADEQVAPPQASAAAESRAQASSTGSSSAPHHAASADPGPAPAEVAGSSPAVPSGDPLEAHFPDLNRRDLEALRRFARALRGGRALLLLGPELSARCGLPSVADLVRHFKQATGAPNDDLRTLCSLYQQEHDPKGLRDELLELLDDWHKPLAPVHQLVAQLPVRHVVTTAVDRQIEEACRQLRRPFCVFSLPQDLAWSRHDLLSILKIRGTLEHPHTLVFSHEDYARAFADDQFRTTLRALLRDHQALAVGLPLDDPDLGELARWSQGDGDGRTILAIVHGHTRAGRRRHQGVTPILVADHGGIAGADRVSLLLGLLSGLPEQRIPTGLRRVDRRRNPFRRLEAYREEDESMLSGREERREAVLRMLEQYRALLLFGESGVGKSSFLQAALMPAFKRLHGPASVTLESATGELPKRWDALVSRARQSGPHLIIIDQLERFFDDPQADDQLRRGFLLEALPGALEGHPDLRILLSIRRDRLADVHPYKDACRGLYHDSVNLPSLTPAQAVHVLLHHFGVQGYTLAPALAQAIVDRTSDEGIPFLPALQLYGHALFEHAEALRLEGRLPADKALDEPLSIGRTDVLQQFVNEALQVFAAGEQRASLLQVLRRLTLHSRRQQLKRDRLADDFPDPAAARAALDMLVDKRLVRFVPEREAYELVHDALVGALEAGPLAAEQHYTRADLLAFYTSPERRAASRTAQRLGVLRYSLRHDLPVHPWLALLTEAGLDPHNFLLDLSREADAALASAALVQLKKTGDHDRLRADEALRRYLITVVFDALYEEEDAAKGRHALELLLQLGLTRSDAQRFLDFIEPTRDDEGCQREGSLSDYDRAMLREALPAVLDAASDEELRTLGVTPGLDAEEELGADLYAELLIGLGRRGLHGELLERCRRLLDEEDHLAFRPEPVFLALARLPDDLRPIDAFDDVRRKLMAGHHALALGELAPALITIVGQLGRRHPAEAMHCWLEIFPRCAYDEAMWPRWRQLASALITDAEVRDMLGFRLSASYSTAEQASLSEVLLWARPGPLLAAAEREVVEPQVAQLVAGLGASLAERLRASEELPSLDALRGQIAEMPPLSLWRSGVALAEDASISAWRRWRALCLLSQGVLDKAARLASQHGFTMPEGLDPQTIDDHCALDRALAEWSDTDVAQRWRPHQKRLIALLNKTPALLERAPQTLAVERVQHWLNVVLVTASGLTSPHAIWPPIGCPVEQLPALPRLMRALGQTEDWGVPALGAHFAELRAAYAAWAEIRAEDPKDLLMVAQWLIHRAAAVAAGDGAPAYAGWFRELRDSFDAYLDPDTLRIAPHDRSRLRWALRCRATEHLAWALRFDPREFAQVDAEEMIWLMEAAREQGAPSTMPPPLRVWLTGTLGEACAQDDGLTTSAEVGEGFEQLCRAGWACAVSAAFTPDQVSALLDNPEESFKRAALLLWAESDDDATLERVARLALEGPASLRRHATLALDRWFLRLSGSRKNPR